MLLTLHDKFNVNRPNDTTFNEKLLVISGRWSTYKFCNGIWICSKSIDKARNVSIISAIVFFHSLSNYMNFVTNVGQVKVIFYVTDGLVTNNNERFTGQSIWSVEPLKITSEMRVR